MDEAALELVQTMLVGQAAALELFARQWCNSPEDVVQEALLRLAAERPLPERPVAWMFRAVRNGAISAARATARRRRYESAAARTSEWFVATSGDSLDAQAAAASLADLPLEQREVVVAKLWGGLSFQEIADLVGISSSAAHRRYVAGLSALRERMGVICPSPNSTTES